MRQVVAELAPTGVLRAGINMSNFLLVTGRTAAGDPEGVAPDMAAEIAKRLGVPVAYAKYERPSILADAAGTYAWDIGLIGADDFTERVIPGNFDLATLRAATYAVSLEPQGGSPSGTPTGPVLFTGTMLESVPTTPRT